MESSNKIIPFRKHKNTPPNILNKFVLDDSIAAQEEGILVEKARNVLDDMEELWEVDHGKVELRDKFHLLRYYLDKIHQQNYKENSKINK